MIRGQQEESLFWAGVRFEGIFTEEQLPEARKTIEDRLRKIYKDEGFEGVLGHLMDTVTEEVPADDINAMAEDFSVNLISRLLEIANGLDTSDKLTAEEAQARLRKLNERGEL